MTVAQAVAIAALWAARFNSADIAELLHLAESEVCRVLVALREKGALV